MEPVLTATTELLTSADVIAAVKMTLGVMGIGITGVFTVLSVFYFTIKIMMSKTKAPDIAE